MLNKSKFHTYKLNRAWPNLTICFLIINKCIFGRTYQPLVNTDACNSVNSQNRNSDQQKFQSIWVRCYTNNYNKYVKCDARKSNKLNSLQFVNNVFELIHGRPFLVHLWHKVLLWFPLSTNWLKVSFHQVWSFLANIKGMVIPYLHYMVIPTFKGIVILPASENSRNVLSQPPALQTTICRARALVQWLWEETHVQEVIN